jgi:hypothetical protein
MASTMEDRDAVQPNFIHPPHIVRLVTPLFFPYGELSIAIFSLE